ncbi:hypothetical protein ACWZHB_20460 [Nocardia sp. FBN12]|uniref:hypothetical protein n=1 Tax=Nocardia sp. FBN12 TaxID=3419766 RepID=UPI003CFD6CFA
MMTEERIAGKTFKDTQDNPPSPELLTEAEAAFAKLNADRALTPVSGEEEPERFHDDMVGTEYEDWYRQKRAQRANRDQ